jgi:hypothetical protein
MSVESLYKSIRNYSDRRDKLKRRWDILNDDVDTHIQQELLKRFSDGSSRNRCIRFADRGNNSFKFIINKLSTVYKEPAFREFIGDQSATDLLGLIIDGELFDLAMEEINKIVVACNACFVRPVFEADTQRINFDILLPHEVEANGRGMVIDEIIYPVVDAAGNEGYMYFNRDSQLMIAPNGDVVSTTVNQYGMVPWVIYRRFFPIRSFWGTLRGEDLVDGYFDQIVMRSWINSISFFQSFKQLAKKPNADEQLSRGNVAMVQSTGPDQILEGDLTTLDLRTDVGPHYAVTEQKMNRMAANYNISSEVINQSKMSSGLERLLSHSGLNEVRKDLIKIFRPSDKELMLLIAKEWDLHSDVKFGDVLQPKITYGQLSLIESPLDEIKVITEGSKIGVRSPVDYILEKDPSVKSREEAIEIVKRNTDEMAIVLESRRGFQASLDAQIETGRIGGNASGEMRANNNQMTALKKESQDVDEKNG